MITAYTFPYDSIMNRIHVRCYISLPNSNDTNADVQRALWDTGAMSTCISQKLADRLGLVSVDTKMVNGANNQPFPVPVYCVQIRMGSFVIPIHEVLGLPMDETDMSVIIGMDIISQGDLAITNYSGRTILTFRTPSLEAINYVEELKLQNKCDKMHAVNVSHHLKDKCACGSGKEYKNCHGQTPYATCKQ